MLKMIFDKGFDTERKLDLDHLTERPLTLTMNGTRTLEVKSEGDWPDIADFIDNPTFTSLEVLDDNLTPLPICEGYNIINDLAINYDDNMKVCSLSVMVGCEAAAS